MTSSLTTDFNVSPYWDDYDPLKNFYRILARPSLPIQAREFTQLQTILQTQISRFGGHAFKDGSIVDGVAITYNPNVHFISLNDTFVTNTALLPTDLNNNYLITNSTNSNNAVRAVIKIAKNGNKVDYPNTNRFYLDYIRTGKDGSNNDISVFSPGDTLYVYQPTQNKFGNLVANNLLDSITTLSSNGSFSSNGYAYCMTVSDGTIFQKGFFASVLPQTITVTDFSTNVSGYVVGFDTLESIVTENEDVSLTDNALGYPNENAPGAHRLKLTPTLVSKLRTDLANNTDFFAIVEFDNNQPTQQRDDPQYAAIKQGEAQTLFETEGDFAIKPFQIETRVNPANSASFFYEVSTGVVYVRGYRVEKIGSTKLQVPKATTTEVAQNQLITGNFGNYVVVDEYLGAFDFETLVEVSLYDGPQNSISEREGANAAPTGNVVGKANVRAVAFETGVKGTPTAQYLVYLFNIQMNSGKSFSNDVKSLYLNGSLGKAKADIVLENGIAVLKDATKVSALFDTGLSASKRLTNNTGINDTTYIYDQVKTATITANGTVTVTIDPAGPGAGSERLLSSTGSTITGNGLDAYNVFLTSPLSAANSTGTVAFTNTSTTVTGTGTSFTTDLTVGQNIFVYANATTTDVRTVTSIANTTSLTLNAPLLYAANASTKYGKYFVDGSPLPLASITINSNTSFTANVGFAAVSNTVYVQYPVYRNQASAIPKVINKNRFVKIDCSNNVANSVGPWDLGLSDIHKIRNVYVGTTFANTNPNQPSWFSLDSGQREDRYDHGRLIVSPQFASQITGSTKLLIELDHFTANTSASVGFFSVDSYPIDDANTANTNAIQTIEIPQFNGKDLRNFIDFRPLKYNTGNSATSAATATTNPATSNTVFNAGTAQYMISPDTNFTADIEYYLPRYDLITIDSTGVFRVNQGVPAVKPSAPFVENDQSVIAESYVSAYPSATKREYDDNRNTTPIRVAIKTQKRYGMKEIGAIDERLKRVEYYTVLNALEQQARDVTIPDANGLDRFKNGIFADPFNSHNLGNVSDFEYKISIDSLEGVARPYFQKHDIDFAFVSTTSNDAIKSSNAVKTGPIITLPYTNELFITQKYATKYRNVTESKWSWNGILNLYPAYDFFRDEDVEPNVNVSLDLAAPWEQFENSAFNSMFGDWRDVSTQTSTSTTQFATDAASGQLTGAGQISTTTSTTQQRTISSIAVDTVTDTINLGSYVKDVAIQPYMRERLVAFVSRNMKPNTTLHAFFDDVNVDAYCAPGVLSGLTNVESGREDRVVNQQGNFGAPLVSDSTGFVCGIFRIPAETFRTGDRKFQLVNVTDLVTGADAILTKGHGTYSADNVSVTKSSTTINIRQPIISTVSKIDRQTLSTTSVVDVTAPFDGGTGESGNGGASDPIAESFSIDQLPASVSSLFIPALGVYFQSKDATLGCSVYICEMIANTPDSSRIIGKSWLPAASINTSTDGSAETVFSFDYPICLLGGNDYAFIVQPDGDSPEYTIWVGETGGFDVATGVQCYSNPYSGTMFVSANRKTWTAIQKEDIKFNIYRARFSSLTGTAVFKSEDDEFLTVNGFTRANNSLEIAIGDTVYTVNSSANVANIASVASNTLVTKVVGRVQYVNYSTNELWIDGSNANSTTFFSNTTNPTIAIYKTSDPSNTTLVAANTLVAYANVTSVNNLKYHTVVPKFGILAPARTSLDYQFRGTSTANVIDTTYQNVINNYDYQYSDVERHVMSRSNEINALTGQKTALFKINLNSSSDFVSPMIDLSKKSSLFVENLINNNTANEHTRYGSASTKYISKRIVLADGQEAEDLNVYMTAYRPADTDVTVYAKFWNPQDPEAFDDKVWTKLQYDDGGEFVYSSPTDSKNYIEYKFSVPSVNAVKSGAFANTGVDTYSALTGTMIIANNSNIITGNGTSFNTQLTVGNEIRVVSSDYFAVRTVTSIANATYLAVDNGLQASNNAALYYIFSNAGNDGIVEYYNSANSRFIGYKEMALKIVLTSANPVKVPRLNDVRAICLQV